ncbi:tRNA pseudouridine synthase A [Marinoscillum furvescens]|uniref:tRNA pseudouridine synthase n=1 Tax=Marinoscillum furvescens DSM 4134 TaxID=1122208 RepID=A0A3D9LA00_MARFU|nr:tRNA pseudouridine(38-40) synthase TruA [Marinoscillum furvescens]REE02083.1 tRNA pseudouridine(38-40) synthase [Marinoscillum furvescens DSM 4134]
MGRWKHFYIVRIQFLGFRYHGWQKQPDVKSVHEMVDKTLAYALENDAYKTLGCGRTDAKVSAEDYAFELFVERPIADDFLTVFNHNLPADIRGLSVQKTDASFNIIQHTKVKEYRYGFSFGEKPHPFTAPFTQAFGTYLNLGKMSEAAALYEGTHNFQHFVKKPGEGTILTREILLSSIEPNNSGWLSASGVNSFIYRVKSAGFMRYQVRLMMGALILVGKEEWTLEDFQNTLQGAPPPTTLHPVPASGLVLHKIWFENQ